MVACCRTGGAPAWYAGSSTWSSRWLCPPPCWCCSAPATTSSRRSARPWTPAAAPGPRRPTPRCPRSQALRLPGLDQPARVSFTRQGLASISAASDPDLYLALGYVHARFRLTQMDLERRLGEGRLAQLAGPGAVSSDQFELRLGLLRTARQEWAAMPRSSPVARDLVAYARGVNDYLAQVRASHQWPAVFSLAGVYPARWTPVDSLVVQGDFTQGLSFTTTPLDYALLERSLGARDTMAWFPVLGPGEQHPYDPGPYRHRGLAPLAGSASTALTSTALTSTAPASTAPLG